MKKILLTFISLISCTNLLFAQTFVSNGIAYSVIDNINNYVEISQSTSNCSQSVIVIPSTVENSGTTYTVTKVGDYAFYGCSDLTDLTLPATVTELGSMAFANSGLINNASVLTLHSVNPPEVTTAFGQGDISQLPRIKVPCTSYYLYYNSNNQIWKDLFGLLNKYDGIEGDIVTERDTIACAGPFTMQLYNPYSRQVETKTEDLKYSGYKSISVKGPMEGCDITDRLNVTVPLGSSYNTPTKYFCEGDTFHFVLPEYNFDTVISTPGYYDFVFTNGDCWDWTRLHSISMADATNDSIIHRCKGEFLILGNPVTGGASIYTSDTSFRYELKTSRGCDSVVVIQAVFHPLGDEVIFDTLCEGNNTYFWDVTGYNLNQNSWLKHAYHSYNADTLAVGTHTFVDNSFTTDWGCSNKKTLNLTINPLKYRTIYDTICHKEVYSNYNFTYNTNLLPNKDTTLKFEHKQTSYLNCDSTTTLFLTVKPTFDTLVNIDACKGGIWSPNAPYTRDNNASILNNQPIKFTSDIYYSDTLTRVNGCDSVVHYNVVFRDTINITQQRTLCFGDSVHWTVSGYNNGFQQNTQIYEANTLTLGEHYFTNSDYVTQYGCKNIQNLKVIVNPVYDIHLKDTVCYGQIYNRNDFVINTNNYRKSNHDTLHIVQTRYLQTINNCDSTVTLDLLVNPVYDTTIYAGICLDGEYRDNDFSLLGNELGVGTFTRSVTLLRAGSNCDSTRTLIITVSDLLITDINTSVCYGDVYAENGFNINTASYQQQNTPFVINDSQTGLHTVKGCDSTVNLTLVVYPVYEISITETICSNETFNFNGRILNTAGQYDTTLQTINGCDSIIHLTLVVNPTKTTIIDTSIVENDSIFFNNRYIRSSGTYTDNLQTVLGCDSTVTLNLIVWQNETTVINAEICDGETYTENNFNENTAGQYTQNLFTINGSDSTVTLNLTVNPVYELNFADNICYGEVYSRNGFNINTQSELNSNPENPVVLQYNQNLQTLKGCDSIINLTLTVNPTKETRFDTAVCEGFYQNLYGFDVDTRGIHGGDTLHFVEHYSTSDGSCDSLVTLNLRVNPVYTDDNNIISAEICYGQTYEANGFTVPTDTSANEEHTVILLNSATSYLGCDSVTALHLTIHSVDTTYIEHTLCYGTSYTENGFNINTSQWEHSEEVMIKYDTLRLQSQNSCDSTVCLKLIINPTRNTNLTAELCEGETYTENDFNVSTIGMHRDTVFSVVRNIQTIGTVGCDSTVTLTVTVHPSYDDTIRESICYGEIYNFYGFDINTSDYENEEQDIIIRHDTLTKAYSCDSSMTLVLTIHSVDTTYIEHTLCYGTSYTENGFNINTSQWEHSDEVMIKYDTLRLQSQNSCDSTVCLKLIINPTRNTNLTAELCEGETYTENDFNVSTIGMHRDTVFSVVRNIQTIGAIGCDSTVTLTVTVHPSYDDTIRESICYGEIYNFYGFDINTSDYENEEQDIIIRHDTLTELYSCDSSMTLVLTIHPLYETNIEAEICYGEIYTENHFYLNSTDYESIKTEREFNIRKDSVSQYACDSVINLHLIVHPVQDTVINVTLLQGESYSENNFEEITTDTVTENQLWRFTQSVQTISGGCDSLVVLNVQVYANDRTEFYDTICDNQIYEDNNFDSEHGFTCNITGTYRQDLQNMHGADSVVFLYLTVMPTYDTTINAEICYGGIYTENHFYVNSTDNESISQDTIITLRKDTVSQYGCDSIVNLRLVVHPVFDTSITHEICSDGTFDFNGRILNTAGLYDTTLQTINGCDSTVHLTLIVHPTYDTTITDSICFGAAYTLNNFNETEAGLYIQELQSEYGCDSVVHLNLKVMNFNDTIEMHICDGDEYDFHGRILTETGFYRDTLLSVWQCDSIINIDLTVHPNYDSVIYDTICDNIIYERYNFIVDTSEYLPDTTNIRVQHLQSVWGCDSTVTLALWVWPTYTIHITKEICEGGSYTDHGYELYNRTDSESFLVSAFSSSHGCDSIFVLDLIVHPTYDTVIEVNICRGETFTMEGYNFNCTETGTYKDTLHSMYNCDSIMTVNLNVHENYSDTLIDYICSGSVYTEHGFYATHEGIYIDTLPTQWGCDSIITLFLLPLPSYDITVYDTACSGEDYIFGNRQLSFTGQYIDTFTTINGCDSIVQLYLTVNAPYVDSIEATICEGETYQQHGFNVTESGIYRNELQTVGNCDSVRILNLHVNPSYNREIEAELCYGETYNQLGFIANSEGDYIHRGQTVNGCDSTVTLHLRIIPTVRDTIWANICEGDTYQENFFDESEPGVYYQELQTTFGCDSIVMLDLRVHKVYDDTIREVIKFGEVYDKNNFNVNETGIYYQYLESQYGCDSTVTLKLEVDQPAKLFIPNAFTPREQYNNCFRVYPQLDNMQVLTFKVFSRTGTLIWETKDINDCWDGKYKGQFVPQGAYIYKVEYYKESAPNKIIDEEGSVMVTY
ncbi:MAG: gliding motility-associated C-terminal domain-containing protein [Bacteroidales bacterium]|nr:gliding motility-associated C-terminal domain-containing protein [Bacteroidales bacterium]